MARRTRRDALPVPDDFAAIARDTKNEDLAAKYGVAECTVRKWRKATGIRGQAQRRAGGSARIPTPEGFAEAARRMTVRELAARFGFGNRAALRMVRELGMTPFRHAPAVRPPREPRQPKRFNLSAYHRSSVAQKRALSCTRHVARDTSIEGRAADYLRGETRANIHRCGPTGRFLPNGLSWRYGNVILTGAELIARAERHGFRPDAWADLPTIPIATAPGATTEAA